MGHQIDVSPDGRLLACAENRGKIVILDLASGDEIKSFSTREVSLCACFSRDGQRLLVGDRAGHVAIWDLQAGKQCAEVVRLRGAPVYCLRHSQREDRAIAAGSEGVVACIDSVTGSVLFETQRKFILRGLAYSPDGGRIAAGDIHDTIALLDTQSGQVVKEFEDAGHTNDLSFSPDGRYLASADDMGGAIHIWDTAEESPSFGQCVRTLDVKANCTGTSIVGAKGLAGKMTWHVDGKECEGTLLEYFAYCGAELDEEQKRAVVEAQRQRRDATRQQK
jgi:WD40 repeat protein